MAAWIVKEWIDAKGRTPAGRPKRKRKKVEFGMRGVRESDRFAVEWIDPTGRRCRRKISAPGRKGKRLADELAGKVTAQLTLGDYEEKQEVSWKEFKERYVRDELPKKRSDRTREEIVYVLDRFERICAPKKVRAITTSQIDEYVARRLKEKTRFKKPPEATTINKDLRHLRAVFNKAVKWKWLKESPDFEMLDEFIREKPLVTEEEFIAMYDACHIATKPADQPFLPADWWRGLFVTCFGTGQRIGALLELEWDQVELTKRRWKGLAEQVKNKRDQYVHFNVVIADHLDRIRQLADPRVFAWNHHKTTLYEELKRIQAEAGLDPKRKDFRFHAKRRSFVTLNWDLLGPDEVQRRTGHRSRSTTERYRVYVEDRREPVTDSFMPKLPPNAGQGAG